jgi:hypothetical protein
LIAVSAAEGWRRVHSTIDTRNRFTLMFIQYTIVSTEDLAQHLDDPNWIVLDCRFTLTDPKAGVRLI